MTPRTTKGYGFIGRDDGPDVFVHYVAIVGEDYIGIFDTT